MVKRRNGMRIAMISIHGYVSAEPPLGKTDTGGQVVYVLEVSKKLGEMGYRVDIFTRQFEDQQSTEKVDKNVTIIRIPCGGKDFIPKEFLYRYIPEWSEKAIKYIKKNGMKYSFINSHYWDAGLAAQNLTAVLKTTHVHTPHSLGMWKRMKMETDFPDDKKNFEEQYNFSERIKYETILYREADIVVATSPMQADFLHDNYSVTYRRIKVIPPGYDDTRFFPVSEASRRAIREQTGIGDKKIISAIGRLARNKGFDLLIEAFKVVADREPRAHLQLAVGKDSENKDIQKLYKQILSLVEKRKLTDRVTIMDSLDDEQMANFYRIADVFALSSRYEPIGMTAIEAMACGTPTVVTTHGGLARMMVFGLDSLVADPLDKYDFGITLFKCLTYNSTRKRLSIHGARKMRSLFTWTGVSQQILRTVEGWNVEQLEINQV